MRVVIKKVVVRVSKCTVVDLDRAKSVRTSRQLDGKWTAGWYDYVRGDVFYRSRVARTESAVLKMVPKKFKHYRNGSMGDSLKRIPGR